jgi:hypothetical protein
MYLEYDYVQLQNTKTKTFRTGKVCFEKIITQKR